ncbi:MAG: glutathione-disulfide reductase [Alphaproteobacteria bacterium]|nr:glutathione-disulfide reductase [Alphaproteobacteria bacterium]
MSDEHFDFFVIGGGSGGVRAARIAAGHGAKVGLAEANRLGGTCVNLGCIPKKLFAYAADYGLHLQDARGYGWRTGHRAFDWKTLRDAKDREIARLNGIYETMLKNAGVALHNGHARFVDTHSVAVGEQNVTADTILVATGGHPRLPDIPGREHLVTSDDMFCLAELPDSIVIVGGGYIGVEFARIMLGLGVRVTLIHHGDMVLRGFDMDIRRFVCKELASHGVELILNTEMTGVRRVDERSLTVETDAGRAHTCGLVLAAIGRRPNINGLDPDAANVETNAEGHILVDENHATSARHIYAVGDVSSALQLTPVALAEGHMVADMLFSGKPSRQMDYDCIPTAVFSNPPISAAGLTEEQARARGYDVETYSSRFTPLKHTISGRDERTLMKLVVDRKTHRVLGCHMAGLDAPEIMQGFAVALRLGATKDDFDRTIGIHPTSAEEFVTMRTPDAKRKP